MRTLLFALALATSAQAKCIANDRWTGQDKQLHLAAGAAVAFVFTAQTGDKWTGVIAGTVAGVAKEALDSTGMGTCSLQDAAVTVIGAGLGAQLGGLMFAYQNKTVQLTYTTRF